MHSTFERESALGSQHDAIARDAIARDGSALLQQTGKARRFSNIQWYMTHSRFQVHLIARLPRAVSREEFDDLVQATLQAAPQLLHHEDVETQTHHRAPVFGSIRGLPLMADLHEAGVISHREVGELPGDIAHLHARTGAPFEMGLPAFRATCVSAPGKGAAIIFESSHGLMEGSDITQTLRGRSAAHEGRPAPTGGPSLTERISTNLLAPLVVFAHVTMSAFDRNRHEKLSFTAFSVDFRDIVQAARRHGISRRAFLFASVLYPLALARTGSVSKLFFCYSTLTRRPLRIAGDEYLNVRMDEMRFKGAQGFAAYAKALEAGLAERRGEAMFTQYMYDRALAFGRALHGVLPTGLPKSYFGFAPQDIVLSLLPPMRPKGGFSLLDEATLYAGSESGRVGNCIFVPGRKEVTYNFNTNERVRACLPAIRSLLAEEGVAVRD